MGRRAARSTLALAALVVASCGDPAVPPAPQVPPAAAPAPEATLARPRARAVPETPAAAPAAHAEVEALLQAWMAAGSGHDEREQARIAAELAAIGPAAMERVLKWMDTGTDAERDAAGDLLCCFGAAAVAPLVARIDGDDPRVRRTAIFALNGFVPILGDPAVGEPVCRALVARFDDDAVPWSLDDCVRALRLSMRRFAADLATMWAGDDLDRSREAGYVLSQLGIDAGPAGPAAVAMLRSGDPDRRELASWVLAAAAGADPALLVDVTSLLDSPIDEVRAMAPGLVARWDEPSDVTASRIAALLDDDSADVRASALGAFVAMPRAAASRLPRIVSATAGLGDRWSHFGFANPVARLCAESACREALAQLRPTLTGADRDVVAAALDARARDEAEPRDDGAPDAADPRANDTGTPAEDTTTPDAVARRLAAAWNPDARGGASTSGADRATDPRLLEALRLAARLGPRGAPLVESLRQIRRRDDWDVRLLSGAALRAATGDDDEVLSVLREAIASTARGVLIDVDQTFQDTGRRDPLGEVVPTIDWSGARRDLLLRLFRRLEDTYSKLQLLPAIERLGPGAAAFVPDLRFLLQDLERTVIFSIGPGIQPAEPGEPVVRTLAAIGAAARGALPEIRRWRAITQDPRGVGRAAIVKIESAPR